MERVSPNGHLGERNGQLCAELRELLDCAQVEAWQAMANGDAADWDRGFAEGVASALALLSGEDRDDLHLASIRRVRGRREIRLA